MADAGGMAENAAEIAVANAINNINGRNRVLAGGIGGGAGQVRGTCNAYTRMHTRINAYLFRYSCRTT